MQIIKQLTYYHKSKHNRDNEKDFEFTELKCANLLRVNPLDIRLIIVTYIISFIVEFIDL